MEQSNQVYAKKTPMVRFQPRQRLGVKDMGGEAASLTNPKKGCANKRKMNMYTARGRVYQ